MSKNYFYFLTKGRLSFLTFFFILFILLLLPGKGYYWRTEPLWQPPKVKAVEFLLPEEPPYPVNQTGREFPFLTARAYFVFDPTSGVILASQNEDLRLPPASTTKMMTALVAQEAYSLNQILTVPEFYIEGRKAKLVKGEKITTENLLITLLVGSANDAAEVLAQNYPGGRGSFLEKMNQKAEDLFLPNTHFVNPTGIDQAGHFSTARDLARLAHYGLADEDFARIVSFPKVAVSSVDGRFTHSLLNINELLAEVPGVKGVKTGWTDEAGQCLVTLVERDGQRIISVILGSSDRFGETKKIIGWVFENFVWKKPHSTHFGSTAGT